MSVVDVLNCKGEKVSQRELTGSLFDVPVKPSVIHEVVTMQLSCRRSGFATVKHRSDVRGSGRKLFRQKGTGRARRGDIKAPLLRGGGVVFGPDNRSYSYKVPKKKKKLALKMALSNKLKNHEIIVIDQFELENVKTKAFMKVMNTLDVNNALIVTEKKNDKLDLSSRNVPDIKVMRAEGINVYDILKYKYLVLLESSINEIERRLLK